jgi:SNW domain-containing protein 1
MTSLFLPPPRNKAPPPPLAAAAVAADSSNSSTLSVSRNSSLTKSSTTTAATGLAKPIFNASNNIPPSYEERCRAAAALSKLSPEERRNKPKLFVPRSLQDFGDGGAFPEIHVAQYPRHMGNPHLHKKGTAAVSTAPVASGGKGAAPLRGAQAKSSTAIVNVEIDADTGKVAYDAIVKRGTNRDKKVYTRLEDLRGGPAREEDIALPTPEEEQAEAEKTQAALNAILAQKTALDKPSGSALQNAATSTNQGNNTQFIKYTPRPDAPGYNPAAAQRIIQMVPAQVDPMMPPKHKHLKAPRGPADDPVPVLHAPPTTKLTKQERDTWNIPACISNWKNSRGYTIPLDKRLAADGRGLLEHSINDNFGTLSESLYVAERQARQEVRMRATVQKKLALQEKERRQEELRVLANQARLERGGGIQTTTTTTTTTTMAEGGAAASRASFSDTDEEDEDCGRGHSDRKKDDDFSGDEKPAGRSRPQENQQQQQQRRPETEEDVAARQREKLRVERKREREKEMRFEKTQEAKKKRLEEERDVSEKIALGVYTGSGGGGDGAGDVDSRLYNQSGGMDTGFGAEDDYNMYTKPMFDRDPGGQSASIYRPTRGETEHTADDQYTKLVHGATAKFVPDKGFAGAESGGGGGGAGPRTAPVQFEKGGQK